MEQAADINLIAAKALTNLIQDSFKTFTQGASKSVRNMLELVFEDYEPYMRECYKKNRYVRILCQGDDDVDLLQVYVETNFTSTEKKYKDTELIFSIGEGKNHVITGAGGAGKTFFMRKLWLDLIEEGKRTPLFIELRKLNELHSVSLETFIRASISTKLEESVFDERCAQGSFIFILDGFDELPKDRHEDIQNQILKLADKHQSCGIVVSGRPDTRFKGWSGFSVYEALPFSLEQTKELCTKVPFDTESKKKFLKKFTPAFYEQYKSFLCNPLLSIMMMMVFRRNMDIPQQMGTFYDEAFCTLYQKHDATKAWHRKKHLELLNFRKVFGAFCLVSYVEEKFDFSHTELEELVSKSKKAVGETEDTQNILDDFERNVNLIREDALRYHFIHRSFQEYFAAYALTSMFPAKFEKFVSAIEQRSSDIVLKLCHELNPNLVATKYLKPKLDSLNKRLSIKKRVAEKMLWGKHVLKIRISTYPIMKNSIKHAPDAKFSVGLGIVADKELSIFHKNYLHMAGKMSNYSRNDFTDAFISEPTFTSAYRWVSEMGLDHTKQHSFIEARLNLDSKTVELSVNSQVDDSKPAMTAGYKPLTIDLTETELLHYLKCSKTFSSLIHDCAKWSQAEIAKARVSDNAVDDFFN